MVSSMATGTATMATAMMTTTTTTMTATATATVTAVMIATTTAAAPFVAPAVSWLLHCSPPPVIVVACHMLSCDRQRSRHRRLPPPLPLQSLVGNCIVVRRPISSSPRQYAIFNSLIATLPPDALVARCRLPVQFPSMVGCCVVVCHLFSLSYPSVAALPPYALVASCRPPVQFPSMVGCCIC